MQPIEGKDPTDEAPAWLIWLAAAAMGLALMAMLTLSQLTAPFDEHLLSLLPPLAAPMTPPNQAEPVPVRLRLDPLWWWTLASAHVLLSSFALLYVPGSMRRALVWFGATLLTATWAVPLALLGYVPQVSSCVAGVFWAGLCILCYGLKHPLPGDCAQAN